jgi:hypothetical protein
MKENWIVQEGHLWKCGIPNQIIVCNYFSVNKVMEYGWSESQATKATLGEYSIGKWIIKRKKNEQ